MPAWYRVPVVEDPSFCRTGSQIIDAIGDLGISALVYQWGEHAEGGWELVRSTMPCALAGRG